MRRVRDLFCYPVVLTVEITVQSVVIVVAVAALAVLLSL